ncbi:MAG: hypothetical protein WCK42_03430 [Myxococcaceae bacterium]
MLKFLLCLLAASFSYAQYSATSTHFVPTPIHLDLSDRISGGVGFEVPPSVELEIAYLYKVWDGLDIGFGFHGGVTGQSSTGGITGTDIVLRFVRPVGATAFLGVQTQIGYVYTGIGDVSKAVNVGSAIPCNTRCGGRGSCARYYSTLFFPSSRIWTNR